MPILPKTVCKFNAIPIKILMTFFIGLESVQFSHSVMSNSLRPHELQHAGPPCPSPTPRVHPNPCLLSQWCHPTTSSSVILFSSCPQSFLASGSFPMSQLFTPGGIRIHNPKIYMKPQGTLKCQRSPLPSFPECMSTARGTLKATCWIAKPWLS